jgi:hypothetical protein
MEVPQNDELGWGLNTSRRTPGRALASQDADTTSVATREARGTKMRKNQVIAEIVNTVS